MRPRKEHPGQRVTFLKYARFVDGDPRVVVDDGTDPPPDAELLTLSQTVTVTAVDTLRVVTDLFVLRRE